MRVFNKDMMEYLLPPLRTLFRPLYELGPTYLGMNEGKDPPDVCSHLSTIGADFWSKSLDNTRECENLINRRFDSYVILFVFVFLAYVGIKMVSCVQSYSHSRIIAKHIVSELDKRYYSPPKSGIEEDEFHTSKRKKKKN